MMVAARNYENRKLKHRLTDIFNLAVNHSNYFAKVNRMGHIRRRSNFTPEIREPSKLESIRSESLHITR